MDYKQQNEEALKRLKAFQEAMKKFTADLTDLKEDLQEQYAEATGGRDIKEDIKADEPQQETAAEGPKNQKLAAAGSKGGASAIKKGRHWYMWKKK